MFKGFGAARQVNFPLPWAAVALLCAVWLIVGTTGHDPWKTDDAVHLGVAYGFFSGGDWLLPRIAGEAWHGTAPFYHWIAAGVAWLTQWALPFHDGARLGTALFGGVFLFFLCRAAIALHGREAGLVAPILAIGTLGLLVPGHDAQPAVATLAASAVAYYGLATLPAVSGAAWLGLGIGLAFVSGSLSGSAQLLPLLLLPLLQRQWLGAAIALIVAIAVGGAWPGALMQEHPAFLADWWNDDLAAAAPHANNLGRDHLELLGWFAWPILPYGLWAAWVERRQWRSRSMALPAFGTVLALAWFLTHDPRPLFALPLIAPLTLLGAAGAHRLRRGAANAFDWFGTMTFTLILGLIWLGGVAMWTGAPAQIARNFAKLEPGFEPRFSIIALLLGLAFTAAWMVSLAKMPKSPWRGAIRWATGVLGMWGLLVALWFPWIDYGKSYRSVGESLVRALPRDHGCIERRNLSVAHRAVFDYHAGLRTQPESPRGRCRWLLSVDSVSDGWRKVWEGHRPGDRSERLRLYRRED